MTSPQHPVIGIDCRFAATHSGIGRYTRELTRALVMRQDPWKYVLFIPEHGTSLALWKSEIRNPKSEIEFVDVPYSYYSAGEQLHFPRIIQEASIDLLHFPHFNAPLFLRTPFIATIHDLILHKFPNEASLPKRLAYRFLMGRTVRRAKHLIAVSHATKKEILRQYHSLFCSSEPKGRVEKPLDSSQCSSLEENTKRISVIHEGISANFFPRTKEEQQRILAKHLPANETARPSRSDGQTSKPLILYVGAAKEHKNIQMLIDACPKELALILVTGDKEFSRLRLRSNVRVLQHVPDADLPGLYSAATAYVSPALTEGFNFPVLEALACGCPVIATNRGATPEILGRFGTLVEPTVEGLTKGISDVTNQKLETNNQQLASAYAKSFTWEKVAEETAKVYEKILGETGCSPSDRIVS